VLYGTWTKENCRVAHEDNPLIYEAFEEYALKATKYRTHYSAKFIFHIIRWNTMISGSEKEHKISDGWISHYARLFMEKHPEHKGFFKTSARSVSYHN